MFKGTTILCVRKNGKVAMVGDGQVTLGSQVVKASAKKVRRLYNDKVLCGFAGATADAMTLLERFERQLDEQSGNLMRAAVALVRDWRTDKVLRRLEAMMLVADINQTLLLSGTGDILEPEGDASSIGSGAGYALAAARAFIDAGLTDAELIARKSLEIAAGICIYTNSVLTVEVLES
ncbi:20S proteasome A and B subunits [Thermovirga lienii DSM 17291]|jgi:ATP-dependent HslUV protease subunit HslV|uniref:20S proteasome A and B subunits n=1 Tax=Thermovirga lienii (strain ATCC BAA-1197 / DSM 17291 / Cas60314) TaxID=580340 RepID=G7V8A7_THELD|nr:ATP-dependent protease subunit HslV [Thermovirga lienii]AER66269.1 20S proteasome A and B subunits [Thermovirga lienii DSM 17291]KUK41960.1 MAG: 20S proteasome A and B subunit [Thermovirga lienii]HCD71756.1 ATP-dependent protease subunit HslV [Thermovirga lienii]